MVDASTVKIYPTLATEAIQDVDTFRSQQIYDIQKKIP